MKEYVQLWYWRLDSSVITGASNKEFKRISSWESTGNVYLPFQVSW